MITGSCAFYFPYITRKEEILKNTVLVWRADGDRIYTKKDAGKNIQKNMVVGTGYRSIGEAAFCGNIKLRNLDLNEQVREIQRNAFLNCTSVKKIYMPGVQKIRQNAFSGCVNLQGAELTKKMLVMERNAFSGCKRLTRVQLSRESRQKKIEDETFRECSSLNSVEMPDEIIEIGRNAFYKCTDLESFFFPKSLRKIGEEAFYQAGLQEIELPDDLEEIGPSAFLKCRKLEYVRIPQNLKIIGKWAFHGCDRLKVLEIAHDPEKIGEWIVNRSTHIRCHKGSRMDRYCQENGFQTEYF